MNSRADMGLRRAPESWELGRMPIDVRGILGESAGQNYRLHAEHINPQFARAMKTIGFDNCYERGVGAHLWDRDGNRYLDMLAGYGVFNVGRNHPDIRRALGEFLSLEHPSLVQMEAPQLSGVLARELKSRVGRDLDRVFFTNSGAEGVETAIKYARAATGRTALIHADHAFHGLTTGALAENGTEVFKEGFGPLLPDSRVVPFNDLEALERELAPRDVAAYIVEPIQGKGVYVAHDGYLAEAARLCRRHGALLIVDEVQTGLGRTGRFLAIDHDPEIEPDIVILSKSLSGGFVPVGAVLCKTWVYDRVFTSMSRSAVHSSTFGQGAFAMVAGLAALQAIDDDRLAENAADKGDRLIQGLQSLVPRFEFLKEIRGRGLMIGIEFGPPRSLALKGVWKAVHGMEKSLFVQAATVPMLEDHRILTQIAGPDMDVIKLIPPLVIDNDDVSWFLAAFERTMEQMHRVPGPVWDVLFRIGRNTLGVKSKAAAS